MTGPQESRRANVVASGQGLATAERTRNEFFSGYEESRRIFDAVREVMDATGPTELRVTRSQAAFWRRKAVARLWVPGRYLRCQPAFLVLTLSLRHLHSSPRWKEIVEPYSGRFTHHLELHSLGDVDDEVRQWLSQAWSRAA